MKRVVRISKAMGVAASAAVVCSCSAQVEDGVSPEAKVDGWSSDALTGASLQWVNGTYGGGCLGRSGSWSLRLGGVAAMDNAALSVVKNNSACVLTITDLVADTTYVATPTIALATSYQATASAFSPSGAPPIAFFGNAKVDSLNYTAGFTLSLLYSANSGTATANPVATYSSVTATAAASSIPAPDYTVSLVSGGFGVQIDANNIVSACTGTLDLTDGSYTGSGYVIDSNTLPGSPSFNDYHGVYAGGSPVAIAGANPTVACASLISNGVDLSSSVVRTILVRRATSNVEAFQAIKVTFSHP